MTHSVSYSDNWELTDWKGFQKVLFRLQRRIFKAQSRMAQSVARRDFDALHRAELETKLRLKVYKSLFSPPMQQEC